MKERTLRMRHVCSFYPKRRTINRYIKGTLFYISEKQKLSYCRVAKVGSTFWTQAFLTLSGVSTDQVKNANSSSLFDLPRDESHDILKQHKELQMPISDRRIQETTSFLVARNPYSRLFSSYIDQIYLPNKWFLGSYMVPGKGKQSQSRKRCAKDITFEEFLKSVTGFILKSSTLDLHWAPIFSICKPCLTNVDILAKQETFNEDAEYILNLVGVDKTVKDEIDNSLKEVNKEFSLAGLVHTYVTKAHDRTNVKKDCISEKGIAERIWSAFQIQGHIHNNAIFPSDRFKSSSKQETEENLTKLVLEAVKQRSLSSTEKNNQREQWKRHFWQQVSLETLQKVQDAFLEDFIVFGYDLDPNKM